MGIGPFARWKHARAAARLWTAPALGRAAVVAGVGLPFVVGRWSPLIALGLLLAIWVIAGEQRRSQIRARLKSGCAAARHWWAWHGGAPRHRGVHRRRDAGEGLRDRARRAHGAGDTVTMGGYTVHVPEGVKQRAGPELPAQRGDIEVKNGPRGAAQR
jgi:cytochrome c-type biogenesis protein CcmF